ncbi:MAG: dTDP-4-dehydrorhamnose reductase [Phycisphaerales bacterium JB060]
MPVAVLGSSGMLGRAMCAELRSRGYEITELTRHDINLADPDSIKHAPRCELLVNCAAWTNVDGAEQEEGQATQVNGHAIAQLLHADKAGTLVTFGTDYVFDGQGTSPYDISHPRAPLNAYGRSKAVGEEALEAADSDRWLHVRTSWLYAPWGNNFVLTMRKLMLERDKLKVVNDQRGRPTSVEHLARTTLDIYECGKGAHWHATDGGECTWYEFAQEIKRLIGATATIEPCTSDQFPRPAKRPAYSVLDISQTEAELGPMPHWKDNLADVLRRVPEGITHA